MKLIQSRDNPFFKELAQLADSARQRNKSGLTLLDGAHLLAAYLDNGKQPRHIICKAAALQDGEISELLVRMNDVPATQLDDKLFAEISELKTPSGIMALIEIPKPEIPVEQSHFALLLEDIQDPGNLGSMLRSAAAAGCDSVFLSRGCADAWSPKVLRAAMGGHFTLHVYENQDLPGVARLFCEQPSSGLPAYPSAGKLVAACLQAEHSLYDSDLTGKVAFLVGNEGAGLSVDLVNLATHKASIPMPGRVESLNVAAATAVCLFEAVRQRQCHRL